MVKDLILVGRFGAAHGVRGEVRLKSFTKAPGAIAGYAPLLDASGTRCFKIKSLRSLKEDLFAARVEGILDRAGAESLTNVEIFASRAAFPEAEADEFYLADLIGLAALNESGDLFGRVVDVHNFGGGDILEIAPAAGGETLLLAFTKEIVPDIDVKAGRLIIAPPDEIEAQASPET
jgi:16S rRNA processing protein RimM